MSDLDRLAETVREWQESGLVPGKEADAVLNVAPELLAVARAAERARENRGRLPELRLRPLWVALDALDAKLREVLGD